MARPCHRSLISFLSVAVLADADVTSSDSCDYIGVLTMKAAMGVSSPSAKRARTDEDGSPSAAAASGANDESDGTDGLAIALAHPKLPMIRPRHLQWQSSCATTLQDSESEDSLLAIAARDPTHPTPPSPSSFDSQLTANLDPNVRGRGDEEVTEVVQLVAHCSDMDTLWRSVQILLVSCVTKH